MSSVVSITCEMARTMLMKVLWGILATNIFFDSLLEQACAKNERWFQPPIVVCCYVLGLIGAKRKVVDGIQNGVQVSKINFILTKLVKWM